MAVSLMRSVPSFKITSQLNRMAHGGVRLTKYDFTISNEDFNKNILRLTNQLWKLIPMREHEEDWLKQLDTVSIEISGMNAVI